MKKTLALLLAVVMVLGMSSIAMAADSVSLNVVTSYGGDDGNRANFEAAVKAYEESTGNKVNDGSATSNEEWKAKVLTDFETGSEPDVLFFFTNADAEPFISAGKVVSIDEIRAEYPDFATNMKSSMMAVAADGTQRAEGRQTLCHLHTPNVARVPDFVARLKVVKILFIPIRMSVAQYAYPFHDLNRLRMNSAMNFSVSIRPSRLESMHRS